MRSVLATLYLSQGVPMLQGGDEFGRMQQGNNNAYCQDNEITWVDWRLCEENRDLLDFARLLADLRRGHAEFRRETFLKGAVSRARVKDVTWLHARGSEMTPDDWQDAGLRCFGAWFGKRSDSAVRLLLLFNAGDAEQAFILPPPGGKGWICRFDTAGGAPQGPGPGAGLFHPLAASSVALLEC
jgi:glycogen operon protein